MVVYTAYPIEVIQEGGDEVLSLANLNAQACRALG